MAHSSSKIRPIEEQQLAETIFFAYHSNEKSWICKRKKMLKLYQQVSDMTDDINGTFVSQKFIRQRGGKYAAKSWENHFTMVKLNLNYSYRIEPTTRSTTHFEISWYSRTSLTLTESIDRPLETSVSFWQRAQMKSNMYLLIRNFRPVKLC